MIANDIRQLTYKGTTIENATLDTIRNKIIKMAMIVRKTKQRVYLEYTAYFPYKKLFTRVCNQLHEEVNRIGKLQEWFG